MDAGAPQDPAAPELSAYSGYAGLPPLVGLMPMAEAATVGLTVEVSVSRLKRLHWALKRLHGIFVARLTAMPIYELKMAFSLHAFYCAEHVSALAARVKEMRQPPYGLDVSPSDALDLLFDEILAAPAPEALVLGLYDVAVPAVMRALDRFLAETHRLFDFPSYRCARVMQMEMRDVVAYGAAAVSCIVGDEPRVALAGWRATLEQALAAAGDLDGASAPAGELPQRQFSAAPPPYDVVPRRDGRFLDPYNMAVNAEAFLFEPSIPAQPKTLMLYFKRLREIDVPEMLASILVEVKEKPWGYYRAMTRQLWDEARHAMMGEIGFAALGLDWRAVPVPIVWSLTLNTRLTPRERHAVLYAIEQGLMPRPNGKEGEWRIACASTSPLAALMQDYDWADEVLHAQIGRKWLVPEFASQAEALAAGDRAWSRALSDWGAWRATGLTEHRNWWPDLYRAACRRWGVSPDPALLAYQTSYESTRADLKSIAG
ncbi:MAG: hypothetical protein ACRD2H_00865 [Terriglobales bacterium]